MILRTRGYRVTSVLGFDAAFTHCQRQGLFDAFVVGHSIPHSEKETLIENFRNNSSGPVVALKKASESQVQGADVEIEPDPEELITTLAALVPGTSASADS